MDGRRGNGGWRILAAAFLLVSATLSAAQPPDRGETDRLRAMREEIARLEKELGGLERTESGILGELERLGAELRLREAELREVGFRLDTTSRDRERAIAELESLRAEQERREHYLAFRIREIYKRGRAWSLRPLLGGSGGGDDLRVFRYAAYLGERDARILGEYRRDAERLETRTKALAREEAQLSALRREAEGARAALERSRAEHARRLETIRRDRRHHQAALAELEAAAKRLEDLVRDLEAAGPGLPTLNIRKFRGLLDPPATGRVSSGFGDRVHPRFRTVVPHPGWDIDAPEGERFAAVFDGRVVYSSWLHGYGLTAIVDHGGGVVSVYAHASALFIEAGREVARGETLGAVGDTGSLRGPYLYFEMRENGQAVDPALWIRRR